MDSTNKMLHKKNTELTNTPPNETLNSPSTSTDDVKEDTKLGRILKVDLHDLRLDDTQSSPFEFKLPHGRVQRLITCHVCQKDLTHMTVQRQQQHLNRCMDKAEKLNKAAAASVILDCPICGKNLKTERQRKIHLKICGKSSGLKPQELLETIKKQETETQQQNDSNIPSIQIKPQAKRPKQKRGRKKAVATKTKQSWETDEELQVAMAISASLTDSESKNALSDLCERKTKKKKIRGKTSRKENLEMPVLLSRSDAERKRITIDRFSNILEWNSDDEEEQLSLPPSRLKRVVNTNQSTTEPHVHYWGLASLTGDHDKEFMSKQSQKRSTEHEKSISILTQTTRTMRSTSEQNESLPNTCKILAELAEDHVTQSPRQQVSTAEPWHKNRLLECFSSLIDNELLSDVKIHCENDTSIHAHSFIIQLRCPDLHKSFSRDDSAWSCDLTAYSRTSVLAFLRYMYAADIDISVFLLPEVISLLKRYHMEGLDHLCKQLQADRKENETDGLFIAKDLDELMEGIEEEEEGEEEMVFDKMSCSDDEPLKYIESDDDEDNGMKSPLRDNIVSMSFHNKPTGTADKIGTHDKPIGTPDTSFETPNKSIGTPDTSFGTPNNPIGTPDKPIGTLNTPIGTPDKPIETPDKPIETPDKPIETPNTPIGTPATPIGTPNTPIGTPAKPIGTPNTPIGTPAKPIGTPNTPIGTPAKPIGTPNTPIGTPAKPIGTPDKPIGTPDTPIGTPDKYTAAPDQHEPSYSDEIPKLIAIKEKSKRQPQACNSSSRGENNDEKETFDCIASTPVLRNFQRRHFLAPATSPILEPDSDVESFSLRRKITGSVQIDKRRITGSVQIDKRRITDSVQIDKRRITDGVQIDKRRITDGIHVNDGASTSWQVANYDSNTDLNKSQNCVNLSVKDDDLDGDEHCDDDEQEYMFAYDDRVRISNEPGDDINPTSSPITDHDSIVTVSQKCVDLTKDDGNKDDDERRNNDQRADNNEREFMFAYDEDVGVWNESGDVCDLTGRQREELTDDPVKKNEELLEKNLGEYSHKDDKRKEKNSQTTISSPTKNMDNMNASVSVASPGSQLRKDALEFSCTQSFLLELQSGKLNDDQLWGGCVVSLTDCQNKKLMPSTDAKNTVLQNKVKKKKKAPTKGKESDVCMPGVDALNTPALKKELSQFGVKALSKKQSKTLLKEIYRQSEIVSIQEEGKIAEVKEVTKPTSHDISESDKSEHSESDSETTDEDDNLLLDENLVCSPTKHGQDVEALLSGFIKQHPTLYTRILLYEAIDFTKLHQDVTASGMKCSKAYLIQFLDKKCINFRFTEPGSQQRKPRGKRKAKRKPKTST